MQGRIAVVAAIAVQRPFLRRWQGVLIDRLRLYRLAQDFIDAFQRNRPNLDISNTLLVEYEM